MLPVNWRIYGMDLEEANKTDLPVWKEMIDYTNDYLLEGGGVSPNSLFDLTERL